MGHAERATQASLEASNNHATRLQHRLAKVIAESSRLHQLLFYTQQCLEGSQAEKVALAAKIKDSEAQVRRTHTAQVQVNKINAVHWRTPIIIIVRYISAGNPRTQKNRYR